MSDNNWNEILENEDRIIKNSDRKHRYHFKSIEAMSEELVCRESMAAYREHVPIEPSSENNFIESVKDKKLANALCQLTAKQLKAVELAYCHGLKHWEIAEAMNCTRQNVSDLISKALSKIANHLST